MFLVNVVIYYILQTTKGKKNKNSNTCGEDGIFAFPKVGQGPDSNSKMGQRPPNSASRCTQWPMYAA